MNGETRHVNELELTARLHEMVDTVGLDHMTPSTVQRRVKQRARRRRFRRCLSSAALAAVALFLVIGTSAAGNHGTADVLVTQQPLVPAATQGSSSPGAPPTAAPARASANVPPPQETTPTTRASVDPSNRHPATTALPPKTSPDPGSEARDGASHDVPTTRGGPADPPSRGN